MMSLIDCSLSDTECLQLHALRGLRDATVKFLMDFVDRNEVDDTAGKVKRCDEERYLLQWGEGIGVRSRLQIACKCLAEISLLVLVLSVLCFSLSFLPFQDST